MPKPEINPDDPSLPALRHTLQFRVRYSETDQMGTFYNSRPLEWFEMGRSELMRDAGLPYTEMESRGFFLPLVAAHVEYQGRARYDDLLELHSVAFMEGRVRLRCHARIIQVATGKPVTQGYTIHAITNDRGRPTRPPAWFLDLFKPALP